ncbi:MAG: chemotaxis protein CheB [Gammaproteobacteria bacterium]
MRHDTDSRRQHDRRCAVVGVGASTGGLAAFQRLLDALPANTGYAFVLVRHLDPSHESLMAELLAAHTSMPLLQVTGRTRIEPDHVYLIPPGTHLRLDDDYLQVTTSPPRPGGRVVIDNFFRSLARSRGKRAVAILLTGSGNDGIAGLGVVQASGGLTIAQRPETAVRDDMPRGALAAGVVDLILAIEEMPGTLAQIARSSLLTDDEEAGPGGATPAALDQLVKLLHARTQVDGSYYKPGTLQRRVRRRMALCGKSDLASYVELARDDPDELDRLLRDLMVSVTDFFRDAEVFDYLAQHTIPQLVRRKSDAPVRVWIPACATGEEAYSIVMLFREAGERLGVACDLKVFATDIDEGALAIARRGIYPDSNLANVSARRRERFFHRLDDGRWQVSDEVRDAVSFVTHDILSDAPFSRMDLVCCRNFLIYVRRELHSRVFETFDFALEPHGALLLGNAESVPADERGFVALSATHRLYRSTGLPRKGHSALRPPRRGARDAHGTTDLSQALGLQEVASRAVLDALATPAVVVDRDGIVRYLHGDLSPYLDLPSGPMRADLFAMLREPVRARVRAGFSRALRNQEAVHLQWTAAADENAERTLRVRIHPAHDGEAAGLLAILFEQDERTSAPVARIDSPAGVLGQLEHELSATRAELRATLHDLEASNEELQSAREHATAMREELQSSNEELEASAEELRSLNEELVRVNQDLREKISQVEDTHNDLENFFASTKLATLFLDDELRVKRSTPAASVMLVLQADDIGRSFPRLVQGIDVNLAPDARHVLATLLPSERELRLPAGTWLRRVVLPYRTDDNRILGVVVTYTDITQLKNTVAELDVRVHQQALVARLGLEALASETQVESILADVPALVADGIGVEMVKVLEYQAETDDFLLREGIGWREAAIGSVRVPADSRSQGGYTLRTVEPVVVHDLATETRFQGPDLLLEHGVRSGISCLISGPDGYWGVLGAHSRDCREFSREDVDFMQCVANIISNVVQHQDVVATLRESESRLRLATRAAAFGIHDYDIRNDRIYWDARVRALFGINEEGPIDYERFLACVHPADRESTTALVQRALAGEDEGEYYAEYRVINQRDGVTRWAAASGKVVFSEGEPLRLIGLLQDIDARKAAEIEMQRQNELLNAQDKRKEFFLATLGHELRNPLAAIDGLVRVMEADLDVARNSVPRIKVHVEHLTSILNDLLELARVTRGRVTLRRTTMNLGEVLRMGAEGITNLSIREKSQSLVIAAPHDLIVEGDPIRIEQIASNLLSNASKFSDQGARIVLTATVEPDGEWVRFDVSDQGRGIAPEHSEDIFDTFVQGNPDDAGLGIGLPLVKELVELHGGTIEARSAGSGLGSTFSVRLPRGNPTTPTPGVEVSPPTAAAPQEAPERPLTGLGILVVDDVRDSAESLAALLELRGARAWCAHSGAHALSLLESVSPDVALLDIALPDLSGYEVFERSRQLQLANGCRFIAVTGFGDPDTARKVGAAGFEHLLVKPVDYTTLEQLLTTV